MTLITIVYRCCSGCRLICTTRVGDWGNASAGLIFVINIITILYIDRQQVPSPTWAHTLRFWPRDVDVKTIMLNIIFFYIYYYTLTAVKHSWRTIADGLRLHRCCNSRSVKRVRRCRRANTLYRETFLTRESADFCVYSLVVLPARAHNISFCEFVLTVICEVRNVKIKIVCRYFVWLM